MQPERIGCSLSTSVYLCTYDFCKSLCLSQGSQIAGHEAGWYRQRYFRSRLNRGFTLLGHFQALRRSLSTPRLIESRYFSGPYLGLLSQAQADCMYAILRRLGEWRGALVSCILLDSLQEADGISHYWRMKLIYKVSLSVSNRLGDSSTPQPMSNVKYQQDEWP